MSLDQLQQFEKLLAESQSALVLLPENPGGDAVGSAWALYFFLNKKNIKTMVAFSGQENNERYGFLQRPKNIEHNVFGAKDFVLAFNTTFNNITDIKTERLDNELRIYITPEKGSIDPRDFSFIPAKFKYDLLIMLDSPDRESLGKIYEENPDIFYEVPVVNIDHHSSNDRYAQINLLDFNASSTAEILTDIFQKVGGDLFDENISECLLTGIIEATNSFQSKNTTPKSLQLSSFLMAAGADQQKIIRYLYKTQPLTLLKFWGRVMAKLRWEENINLVWAPILLEDFIQSRSNPSDVSLILEKIKENYSTGKIFMVVFNENPGTAKVVVRCSDLEVCKKMAQLFSAELKNENLEFYQQGNDLQSIGEEIARKISEAGII